MVLSVNRASVALQKGREFALLETLSILEYMAFLRPLLVLLGALLALPACGPAPQVQTTEDPDLQQIQGSWRLELGRRGHVIKQITGNQEVVSHYDRKGVLQAQHSASIGVQRIYQDPPVRVFYFSQLVVSLGELPAWPHDQTKGHYVYTCDGTRFVEYQWSVGDLHVNATPRVVVWRRDDFASPVPYLTPAPVAPAPGTTYPDQPPSINHIYQ